MTLDRHRKKARSIKKKEGLTSQTFECKIWLKVVNWLPNHSKRIKHSALPLYSPTNNDRWFESGWTCAIVQIRWPRWCVWAIQRGNLANTCCFVQLKTVRSSYRQMSLCFRAALCAGRPDKMIWILFASQIASIRPTKRTRSRIKASVFHENAPNRLIEKTNAHKLKGA